ncbi:hypothetical protein Cgig2_031407 [Carnegiea gigantea]|uniref:Metal tolerance protein B n=1 Tax=Carnegiea gigantea TaxID=171969 RepID=A0A9Q1K5X5_9CARY|nr:hypothetical protein Cgig2_031407 [Carnegiea gigantea]
MRTDINKMVTFCTLRSLFRAKKACASSTCAFSLQENPAELQGRSSSKRKLVGLIIFYTLAMAVEIVGGIKSNSLAVLTDAAHMFSDVAGFAVSLFAVWASGWKPTAHQSFGFYRLEVLAALLSVQLIWLISGFLMFEAIDRILHETGAINGKVMFLVASFGFAINLIMLAWMGQHHLHHNHGGEGHHHAHAESTKLVSDSHNAGFDKVRMYTVLPLTDTKVVSDPHEETNNNNYFQCETNKMNINLQGAYLHVVSDLIQSVGVMIAGAVIWVKPNWVVADLICTTCFSIAVLISTKPMLADVYGILMERTPREIDINSLENGLKSVKGVSEVHDLHVWSITVGKTALSCHVNVEPDFGSKGILHDIRQYCQTSFQINHVTVQIEQE